MTAADKSKEVRKKPVLSSYDPVDHTSSLLACPNKVVYVILMLCDLASAV